MSIRELTWQIKSVWKLMKYQTWDKITTSTRNNATLSLWVKPILYDILCDIFYDTFSDIFSAMTLKTFLQERRHIGRNIKCFLFAGKVLRIDQISILYSVGVLRTKCIQRCMSLISWWLDFNRAEFRSSWKEKIHFVIMLFILWPCMVEELVSWSHQHLGDKILIYISQIHRKLICQQI